MDQHTVIENKISKEEFERWVDHPVTQLLKNYLTEERDNVLTILLNNFPVNPGQDVLLINGEYKGRINATNAILGINYNVIDNIQNLPQQEK